MLQILTIQFDRQWFDWLVLWVTWSVFTTRFAVNHVSVVSWSASVIFFLWARNHPLFQIFLKSLNPYYKVWLENDGRKPGPTHRWQARFVRQKYLYWFKYLLCIEWLTRIGLFLGAPFHPSLSHYCRSWTRSLKYEFHWQVRLSSSKLTFVYGLTCGLNVLDSGSNHDARSTLSPSCMRQTVLTCSSMWFHFRVPAELALKIW